MAQTKNLKVVYTEPVTRRIERLINALKLASNAPGRSSNELGSLISHGRAESQPPKGMREHSEKDFLDEIEATLEGLYRAWDVRLYGRPQKSKKEAVCSYGNEIQTWKIALLENCSERLVRFYRQQVKSKAA